MAKDTDIKIDDDVIVPIPDDTIALGHDPDGLPKTVSTAKEPVEKPKRERRTPTLAELEALRQDRDARVLEAQQRTTEADAAKAEAEAERGRSAQIQRALYETQDYSIKAHQHAVTNAYRAAYSDHQAITGAVASHKSELETAKQVLKNAHEAGDHGKIADATAHVSSLSAALVQLESAAPQAKAAVDAAAAEYQRAAEYANQPAAKAEPTVAEPTKAAAKTEPVARPQTPDQWIDAQRAHVGDDGADWLREHKDFVTDTKKNAKLMLFAQEYVIDNGADALKSEAFIDALNSKFFPEEPEVAGDDPEPEVIEAKPEPVEKKTAPKAKTTPAAPVSRGGPYFSSRNQNAGQIKLPPKLAAFVKASGLDPVQYALGAHADIKAGKLPANFLDPDYPH